MEPPKETEVETSATAGDSGKVRSVVVELPLGKAATTFDLEKAVCSHGLFMMAPNHWDPSTKTFQRPLLLIPDAEGKNPCVSPSFIVRISQPFDSPHSLHLRVFDTESLSPQQQQSLMDQVRRMLRLSDEEERKLRDFWEVYGEAKAKRFGRVFRSPILFEDMVKCILLCNCQWPRTLSMARALCKLQLELHSSLSCTSYAKSDNGTNSRSASVESEQYVPRTLATKEKTKKRLIHRSAKKLTKQFSEVEKDKERDAETGTNSPEMLDCVQEAKTKISSSSSNREDCFGQCVSPQASMELFTVDSCSFDSVSPKEVDFCNDSRIGSFPTPSELISFDESYLAKRCNLGYRAGHILNLARRVTDGSIQLRQLEEMCSNPNLSSYNILVELLSKINGFGPFTCANVLMCMGFYHVIPTDSETLRHLKQVHKRNSSIRKVHKDIQAIYEKYAPFQFLVYWSEVWHYYEERFGKLSEMSPPDYKLITATNMKPKTNRRIKGIKTSVAS